MSAAAEGELHFAATEGGPEVSALLLRPADPHALIVLGHGAGAGMRHPFLAAVAERLADHGVATLRYQFPYMERSGWPPDPRAVLLGTCRAAAREGRALAFDLPLFAGGKSMGGRMTSLAVAEAPLPGVRGLVFLGFPLHPAGRPATERAEHLSRVELPMLFLQGTRDRLADLSLLEPVCRELGGGATLRIVEGADHGFHVLVRSGRTDDEVLEELAAATAEWVREVSGTRPVRPSRR